MTYKIRPLMKNKPFGVLLFLLALLGFAVIIYRVVSYVFEYDPQYYTIDYGRYNFFSYFTVQSNIFVSAYLLFLAFAVFGSRMAMTVAFNPTVRLFVTTYIIVTGAVYCGGFPLGMSPPLHWDTFYHAAHSFIQVFHHMIIPPFTVLLFFLPPTERKIPKKSVLLVGIYPFVYSLFSIARGALTSLHFYPYPFYKPEFFWDLLLKGREFNLLYGYLLLFPMLILGIGIFILLAAVLRLINNKIVSNMSNTEVMS